MDVRMGGSMFKCLHCPKVAHAKVFTKGVYIYECDNCGRVYKIEDITAVYDELDENLEPIGDEKPDIGSDVPGGGAPANA